MLIYIYRGYILQVSVTLQFQPLSGVNMFKWKDISRDNSFKMFFELIRRLTSPTFKIQFGIALGV